MRVSRSGPGLGPRRSGAVLAALLAVMGTAAASDSPPSSMPTRDVWLGTVPESDPVVVFAGRPALATGARVYIHAGDRPRTEARVGKRITIGHPSNQDDHYAAAQLQTSAPISDRYFLVTTRAPSGGAVASPAAAPVNPRAVAALRRLVLSRMEHGEHPNGWNPQFARAAKWQEDLACRRFEARGDRHYAFCTLRMIAAPTGTVDEHLYDTPYFGLEAAALELDATGEVRGSPVPLAGLSFSGGPLGDGLNLYRRDTAADYLAEILLGVYDTDDDGSPELILNRLGAEASTISVSALVDGALRDLGIAFGGGR